MKKNETITKKIEQQQKLIERLEAFETIMSAIDHCLNNYRTPEIAEPYWKEEKEDPETGEIKTVHHWEKYVKDEDGEVVYKEPDPDSYGYDRYLALIAARDEIIAII